MNAYAESQKYSVDNLNELIQRAMNKVNVQKEKDLCWYLPGKNGRLHHFGFEKLKLKTPSQLQEMIKDYILGKENPERFPSKPRNSLMVKRTAEIKLKRSQINLLVEHLKNSENQAIRELLAMFSSHQTLGQVQKAMLDMVRNKQVDETLWTTYVKLVEKERAVSV